MAVVASAKVGQVAGMRRWLHLLGAVCAGVAAALIWGSSLSPVTIGLVGLVSLGVLGLAGLWFIVRADEDLDTENRRHTRQL